MLIALSIEGTAGLVPFSNLNRWFFRKYRVPPRLQELFVSMYEKLRTDLEQVSPEHRNHRGSLFFLLSRAVLHSADSLGDFEQVRYFASARNPVYMAFALQSERMPDWQAIGNPTYIRTLARSFGASEHQINEGIWVLLRRPAGAIFEAAAQMIAANLESDRTRQPGACFENVIVPYLTFVSKDYPVHGPIEENVFSNYHEVFGRPAETNELHDFTEAFKGYMAGMSLNVRYLNDLNAVLGRYGYRLYVHDKTCIGYRILDHRIAVRRRRIGDVIFLKKISVCLSMGYLGLATTNESDVVVAVDEISDYVHDITYALNRGQPPRSMASAYRKSWNDMRTGLTPDSADAICAALMHREHRDLTHGAVVNKMVKSLAVHEVKHKWDETTAADSGWYILDCETSAHMTEILYGGAPLHSLVSLIYRHQDFFAGTGVHEVRGKLRPLIGRYWQLAQGLLDGTIDDLQLKNAIREMYSRYMPLEGGPLPSLDEFHDEVVATCLDSIPSFDIAELR